MLEALTIIKCDCPGCEVSFTWAEEDATKENFNLPDGAYKFLILAIPFGKAKWTFCSKFCLLEFLKTLVPVKSPREQLAEVEAKRKEIEEKEKQAAEVERMANEGGLGK